MDQYTKDRADIDQLHKDLEHQVELLIAENKRLRLVVQHESDCVEAAKVEINRLTEYVASAEEAEKQANELLSAADDYNANLVRFVDFVNLWCNRETKVSDTERLSVIKHHPTAQSRLKIQPVNG